MSTITVKNIPPDLYEQLKTRAATNRRSINSEIIVILEQALAPRRIDPDALLAQARQLRERSAAYSISNEAFDRAKNEGRS